MTTITRMKVFSLFTCGHEGCGVSFALDDDFIRARKSDRGTFYCPNGHARWFPGETDTTKAQRLAGELDMERTRLREARKQLDYAQRARKNVSTRLRGLKKRVAHGVCPCCHRTFKQLAEHMADKHPQYKASVE